ncbi:MAG TPA: metallopeptidase TldD-related protein, partial [Anaeromyxobacteraceae bacterium]|nr:metallopeptidase TldD-related protein [Anaeromyxobacteraceae bacterium]
MTRPAAIRAAAAALAALAAVPAPAADDVPLRAMKDELARSVAQLRLEGMERPYFVAYGLDDLDAVAISATLGSLESSRPWRGRRVRVEVRVGDPSLDNGNFVSSTGGPVSMVETDSAPLDDDYRQIRRQLWLATDAQYKKALESLAAKRAALEVRKGAGDLPDFGREPPASTSAAPLPAPRRPELEALARELSAVFRSAPEILRSSVAVTARTVHTRYVNSDGTVFTRASASLDLEIGAEAHAPDGMPISDAIAIRGRTEADLPPREVLLARVREMAARILALRSAPTLERYDGPVLFEGEAGAEVFLRQLAPSLLAVRQPVSDEPRFDAMYGQMLAQLGGASFDDRVGARVLPETLSVTDRPGQDRLGDALLLGGQGIDDDGVVPRETRLVERGVLRALLASRIPTPAARRSTGSRRGPGPVPSNLLVTAERAVAEKELRRELLRLARARGLDHAIVVRRVGAGAAASSLRRLAGRMGVPVDQGSSAMAEVYRIGADGSAQLLRGVELGELGVAAFKEIAAAGDAP